MTIAANTAGDHESELHVFLLEGARWQDFLLQSYRTLHLTVQSILLAIGTGLMVAALGFDSLSKVRAVVAILWLIAAMSLALLAAMRRVVLARGKDVNFWHTQIIDLERAFPSAQRYFTYFKINQKKERDKPNLIELFLSDETNNVKPNATYLLVEEQLGHTRKILDRWLFGGIIVVWIVLLTISLLAAKLLP